MMNFLSDYLNLQTARRKYLNLQPQSFNFFDIKFAILFILSKTYILEITL